MNIVLIFALWNFLFDKQSVQTNCFVWNTEGFVYLSLLKKEVPLACLKKAKELVFAIMT